MKPGTRTFRGDAALTIPAAVVAMLTLAFASISIPIATAEVTELKVEPRSS